MIFVDCPAYTDAHGLARCGLPAEIHDPYLIQSTDGPLESARIRCPLGHIFNGPIQSLAWDDNHAQPAEYGKAVMTVRRARDAADQTGCARYAPGQDAYGASQGACAGQ
jgi:hypothetical protein